MLSMLVIALRCYLDSRLRYAKRMFVTTQTHLVTWSLRLFRDLQSTTAKLVNCNSLSAR